MRLRFLAWLLVIFGLFVTAGCATTSSERIDLPEDIGDKGLVVGQVMGVGRFWHWSNYTGVLIDDRRKGQVVNGLFAIPLSPGDYELSGLYSESSGGSGSYGNVSVRYTNVTTVPVKRKFSVRPKGVTNIGLIVLYPDAADKEQRKFTLLVADNSADMRHFLRGGYPALAERLNVAGMTLAPGPLMPADLIQGLRKELAAKSAYSKRVTARYVADNAGTLVEVSRDASGKATGARLIDVPTLANVQSQSADNGAGRFAFLTTNNRLFVVQDGKVVEKRAPAWLRSGNVFVLGATDLAVIDDQFEIYMSRDNGDHWQPYLGAVGKKRARGKAAAGAAGYYLYANQPPRALFVARGGGDFRPVALPPAVKDVGALTETSAGLFVEPEMSMYMETEPRKFYIRPAGKMVWEMRSMATSNCAYIRFPDSSGLNLVNECGDRASAQGTQRAFQSKDGGKTWSRK